MNTRRIWLHASWIVALAAGLTIVPGTIAKGGRGGHGGGHAPRAPHISSGHHGGGGKPQTFKAPKMPHVSAPSHKNGAKSAQVHHNNNGTNHATSSTAHHNGASANGVAAVNTSHTRAGNASPNASMSASRNAKAAASPATGVNPSRNTAGVVGSAAALGSSGAMGHNGNGYTYGTGTWARNYRAYGYGHGYRNRYYGRGYGYGRSQGNNRAVVSRLRSVHVEPGADRSRLPGPPRPRDAFDLDGDPPALAPVDDLPGHGLRVRYEQRAEHLAMGRNDNLGANGRRGQPMSQAQSDARMGQSLRTLQGIDMQLANQGSNTTGHARARGHVTVAIRELNTALSIR